MGYRRILVHGLGGTSKTPACVFFVWRKIGKQPTYLQLPSLSEDAAHFYDLAQSLNSVPEGNVGIILDELDKLCDREVIGWLCKTLDLEFLTVGITNDPTYLRRNIQPIWRRFADTGILIYSAPPDYRERISIVRSVLERLNTRIAKEEERKLAKVLEGFNFSQICQLLRRAEKRKRISSSMILKLITNGNIQPSSSAEDERRYLLGLQNIQGWDIRLSDSYHERKKRSPHR